MKKIAGLCSSCLLACLLLAGACNSTPGSSQDKMADSSAIVPAPVDNANATNSSLADTSYPKKDSLGTKADSSHKGQ